MASEYELKLKAVLDDTDVQQKLQQLKKQQSQQEGGGQPGQGALGNIGQAIQRLNTSIADLERAIEKLAASQGKPGTQQLPVALTPNNQSQSAQAAAKKVAEQSPMGAVKEAAVSVRKINKELSDAFGAANKQSKVLRNISHEFSNFSKHGWTAKQLYERPEIKGKIVGGKLVGRRVGSNGIGQYQDYTPVDEFLQKNGEWVGWDKGGYDMSPLQKNINAYRKDQLKRNPILRREAAESAPKAPMSKEMKAQMRLGASLAFTALAGGVGNYAQATGNTGLQKGAKLVENVGMGAAAGGLVGGPVGALIGGGIGALNTAFEELASRARDAAEALEEQAARVRGGRRFDIQMKDFEQQRQDKEMMKKQTSGTAEEKEEAGEYFRTQLEGTKKKYENVRANMEKSGIAAEGGVEAYEQRTKKLLELRGKDDAEVKQRQETVDIYKDQFYWLQKHSNRIEQLEGIVSKPSNAKEPSTSSQRELATSRFGLVGGKGTLSELILSKTKDFTRYGAQGGARGSAAADQAEMFKEALSNLKAPDMTPINSLASQGLMIGSGAADEDLLDETNKYLNEIAHLTREIKDKEGEAAAYS